MVFSSDIVSFNNNARRRLDSDNTIIALNQQAFEKKEQTPH